MVRVLGSMFQTSQWSQTFPFDCVRIVYHQRQRLRPVGDAVDLQRRIHVLVRVAVFARDRSAVRERRTREFQGSHRSGN
jgi:hypothetical protein